MNKIKEIVVSYVAHVGVCFSGGFDSTAMLLHYLQNGSFVDIISVYFTDGCSGEGADKELEARNRIIDKLSKKYSKQIFTVSTTNYYVPSKFSSMAQAPIFMTTAPMMSNAERIAFGYITTDNFWHKKTELVQIFDNTCNVIESKSKIEFPFEWYSKKDIFDKYYKQNKWLFDMVWVTNSNKSWKQCNCDKSRTMKELSKNYKS